MRLKISALLLFLLIAIVGFVPAFRSGFIDSISAIYASVLVNLVNRDRTALKIAELKINPVLQLAAQLKADDMATKGYFAHNSPDGKTPWYWFESAGYKYTVAGENLAVNFADSEQVHTAWMNSTGHRANLINSRFTEIGIATSTGSYKGRQAVFVVQMFGKPQ